jgi:DNA polymerase III delta prime subunit
MTKILWVDKFSPKNIDEYLCKKSLKKVLLKFVEDKDIPHLLLYGNAGIGKTTLSKLLIEELGAKSLYINGSIETSVDVIRDKVLSFCSTTSFNKMKVVLIDEFDKLSDTAKDSLKATIEQYQHLCRFIFTTNYIDKIPEPIISRCTLLDVSNAPKKQILNLCVTILEKEDIDYDIEELIKLVENYYPDIRSTIKYLQHFSQSGLFKFNETDVKEFEEEFVEILVSKIKPSEKYVKVKQLFIDNDFNDWNKIYQICYNRMDDYCGNNYCDVVISLAKYVYQSKTIPNQEINLMACLSEIFNLK